MTGQARPMTTADYADGSPVPIRSVGHPMFDIVFGAIIAAAAFWVVPKVLDYAVERVQFGGDDDETELKVTG